MPYKGTMLVAGASGIVGRAALEHFASLPEWDVIGVSRRPPDTTAGRHVPLDLNDAQACREVLGAMSEVTHVIYAALYEKPGLIQGWFERDQMETNLTMLRNFFEPLEAAASRLEHVSLLQGTKAYGAHVHPMRIPGKEDEARVQHENFYWLQEDWLRERSTPKRWRWTIWRPPVIFGHALGAPMNVLAAIGAYAAICRAQGQPLRYPGGAAGPLDGIDARLLARAFEWATHALEARDETFNVANGDVFRWQDAWPTMAAALGVEPGDPEPCRLAETMPAKADVWDRVVDEHDLQAPGLKALVGDSFLYADMLLAVGREAPPPPTMLSTIKVRQAGFGECLDTEVMFAEWFRHLQRLRILPPA